MRVTQNMLFNQVRGQLASSSSRLLSAQEVVATQKKINRLSDNAIDGGRVLDLKDSIARTDQFMSNVNGLLSLSDAQDTALGNASDLLSQAKQLLLTESDDVSSTPATREAARTQILNISEQLVQIGNTRFDGQYIFGGFQTQSPPYNPPSASVTPAAVVGRGAVTAQSVNDSTLLTGHAYKINFTGPGAYDILDVTSGVTVTSGTYTSGQPIVFDGVSVTIADAPGAPIAGDSYDVATQRAGAVYSGDNGVQKVEVQDGSYVNQNIPGSRVFQGVGVAGGVDAFSILTQAADALKSNDRTAIGNLLGQIDAAYSQMLKERSGVGAQNQMLTAISDRQTDMKNGLDILRSDLEDADITDAVTEFNKQQNVYTATLNTASHMVQQSLLDFLH